MGVEFTLHCTVEFKMEKFAQILCRVFFKNGIDWESQFVISVYQLAALVAMMCPFTSTDSEVTFQDFHSATGLQ